MSGQEGELDDVYKELGRYWASFSFLDETVRWLCAALVAPDVAGVGAVIEEVDISRLCSVVLPRAMKMSDRIDVQALATRWQGRGGTLSRLMVEIDWRNVVAHSSWSVTLSEESRMQLVKTRRGVTTSVTVELLRRHHRAVERARNEVAGYLEVVEGQGGVVEDEN